MKQLILKILCFLLIGGRGAAIGGRTNGQFKNMNAVTWDSSGGGDNVADDDVPSLLLAISESDKRASNLNEVSSTTAEHTQEYENVTNDGGSGGGIDRHKRNSSPPISLCDWKCNCINENNFLTVDCDLLQPEVSTTRRRQTRTDDKKVKFKSRKCIIIIHAYA